MRRTNRELLLDTIRELSNNGTEMVSNRTVMQSLGWTDEEDDKYWRVRQELIDDGLVEIGKGPGGAVSLARRPVLRNDQFGGELATGTEPGTSVFVSYAHEDAAYLTEFKKHAVMLKRSGLVSMWHDAFIPPGGNIDTSVQSKLQSSNVIVLLVSSDFLDSFWCYDIELDNALDRRARGEAAVIPVILRPCNWPETPLKNIRVLPREARPISLWEDRDSAWLDVVEQLTGYVREMVR